MDPATLVLGLGFLGGLLMAVVVVLVNRRAARRPAMVLPYRLERVSPNMINMASIKVAGIGGLGLVAMAAAVALDVPQIGQSIAIGFGLGAVGAVIMIVRARRSGPMPSSGQRMGANTTLSIDEPGAPSDDPGAGARTSTDAQLVSAT